MKTDPSLARNGAAPGTADATPYAHLTDAQFTDLLLGAAQPAAAAHLALCPQCAEEAKRFNSAVASFEQQSRLWAERRASTQSLPAAGREAGVWWLRHPAAWPAAAAALILAATLAVGHRGAPAPISHAQPVRPQAASPVAVANLQSDNQLLSAIDGELSSSADTRLASGYGLSTSVPSAPARSSRRIAN